MLKAHREFHNESFILLFFYKIVKQEKKTKWVVGFRETCCVLNETNTKIIQLLERHIHSSVIRTVQIVPVNAASAPRATRSIVI
jgi:hypothetical protein